MEKFRKLGIIMPILKSIQELKFEEPTEIQEKSIPLILKGEDVIAGASTGSGKTLAFASRIIEIAEKGNGLQSLILTPTRELAEQVSTMFQRFAKHKYLEIIAVYGGVSINPQIKKLRTANIVVGTPGRILDHMHRRTIKLDHVKVLVLDEADRMLDMGFKKDVGRIIDRCPGNRQTLLFSATISNEIDRLANKYTKNPVKIFAEAYVDPSKLKQIYYEIEDNLRFSLLVHFLKKEKAELVMVFCNTQRNTDFVANNLKSTGISALAIHGGYSQGKRSRTMQEFNSKNFSVLVCTDVAARGLDIKGVSHIYNYDIPGDDKDYIHRIGRTARAGKEGKVINIVGRRDYENFQRIIYDEVLNIPKGKLPKVERIAFKYKDNRTRGRGRDFKGRFGRSSGSGRSYGRSSSGRGDKRYNSHNRSEGRSYSREGRHSSRSHSRRDNEDRYNGRNSREERSEKRNFNIDYRY